MGESKSEIIERLKNPWLVVALSVLINLGLIFYVKMATPYFSSELAWGGDHLSVAGILIYNGPNQQRSSNSEVEHVAIKCNWKKQCALAKTWIIGRVIISDPSDVAILELDYANKTALFELGPCRFSVSGKAATFLCQSGQSGTIGVDYNWLN